MPDSTYWPAEPRRRRIYKVHVEANILAQHFVTDAMTPGSLGDWLWTLLERNHVGATAICTEVGSWGSQAAANPISFRCGWIEADDA